MTITGATQRVAQPTISRRAISPRSRLITEMRETYSLALWHRAPPGSAHRLVMRAIAVFCLIALWAMADKVLAQPPGPTLLLRTAVETACNSPGAGLQELAGAINARSGSAHENITSGGAVIGWRRRFIMADRSEIVVERISPGGRLRRVSAEYRGPSAFGLRPEIFALAGADCTIRLGRRLVYENGSPNATTLQYLDERLVPTTVSKPMNPPVPQGEDPGGVAVAVIDAGVNYLLPEINARLARDPTGKILGYDFWDMDDRPFDANPARSAFFPRRHGTGTASVILREAQAVRLIPYRYPRPDMSRMSQLVHDAAAKGAVIVNLSMGSDKPNDWTAFARAVRAHPEMLFVVSAGNNGRDIDERPVYPAALPLDNMITVTSSEVTGRLARGSNRGVRAVDLLVPGENLPVIGFNGRPRRMSGSSYAAPRIAALAARLLAQHPDWRAPQLKAAIFGRAIAPVAGEQLRVSQGMIPDPAAAERRPVAERETVLRQLDRVALGVTALYPGGVNERRFTHALRLTFAYFGGTTWDMDRLRRIGSRVTDILGQCGVFVPAVDVYRLAGPEAFRYYQTSTARALVRRLPLPKPTVYFVRDTLQRDAYDAEAIGKGNSKTRPTLIYTVWMTQDIADPAISLAHELVHMLIDSGEHVEQPGNLMRADSAPENIELTSMQCRQAIDTGTQNGLLSPLARSP